jgi:DNA cross-link repair 1C protein
VLSEVKQILLGRLRSNQNYVSLDDMGLDHDQDDLNLSDLIAVLSRAVLEKRSKVAVEGIDGQASEKMLPKFITFPYARHSSYSELCHLVKEFNPKDIFPCTVDEDNWNEGMLCFIRILSEL